MSNTQTEVSEHDAIAKTNQHYIDGATSQTYYCRFHPSMIARLDIES